MKKQFSEEQIVGILRKAEAGLAIKDLCRKHGFSETSYYAWRSKYGGMDVSDVKRLKSRESENARLERLQVQRRRLKKRELTEWYPLGRPSRCNAVWSMDFGFDRTANGRTL